MKTLVTTLLAATALTAVSGGAMAADLAVPGPAPVISAPAPTNWDGPYIGASVGYGWGTASDSYTGIGTGAATANLSGWLLGAQAGYNFHLSDNIVAGVEGNIDWVNESGKYGFPVTQSINWEGSIRGRLGVDIDNILPYVEAGVAFANSTFNGTVVTSNTQTGWTVGAGVEFMLADNLSANVEYRYSDYGTANYPNVVFNDHVHLTDNTLRLGLNYHF